MDWKNKAREIGEKAGEFHRDVKSAVNSVKEGYSEGKRSPDMDGTAYDNEVQRRLAEKEAAYQKMQQDAEIESQRIFCERHADASGCTVPEHGTTEGLPEQPLV